MIAIFGAGEIAEKGIVPVVGGTLVSQGECDVTDWFAVERTMGKLEPDVVVFTAGISAPQSILGGSSADWRSEVQVNLIGGYHVLRAAAEAGAGTLIAIASLAGLYGKPNHSGYSASKSGLISLVQSLAMEGHDAYAISPGRVNTSMRERDYPGEDPRTRLEPTVIGGIVRDILDGQYEPGDNIVVRMRGFEQLPIEVHRGDGWREKLMVGQPKTC